MSGLIYNIQHYSIHDGPGIRTTVFLKGCPMRCRWCHNPESQEPAVEHMVMADGLDGRRFERKRAVGRWQSAEDIMKEIEKDAVFYAESGGGVTFSGGEPMMQADFLAEILKLCRLQGIHTAIDTCGHAEPAAFVKVTDLTDLFLFDIKLMDDVKHQKYTGVSNKFSLRNLEMLARSGSNLVVRFPVIPGITDERQNITEIIRLMNRLHLRQINLLPYHSIARDKYRRLGRQYLLQGLEEPGKEIMESLKKTFADEGIEV